MTIDNELTEVMKDFKENNIQKTNNLEKIHNIFEKMVDDGVIERPKYNLAPITTLPAKVIIR